MAEKQYHRLTWARRRQSSFIVPSYTRSSLWLGKDHLLCIDSSGFSESYKRFYFQDIQAVTIRLTKRRVVWNWVLGVPTAICIGVGLRNLVTGRGLDWPTIITGIVLTTLFGLPLLINNLRGSTCSCQLRTAVQTEDLPSLCRLPKTRRVLARLRPLIAAAQGQLAPEEIPARVQMLETAAAAPAAEERSVIDDPSLPPRIVS